MERGLLRAIAGIALGLLLAALVASLTPAGVAGFVSSLEAVASSSSTLRDTMLISAPIALSAIGLVLTYRARFFTIASEGQVIAGSAAALWVAAYSGLDTSPLLVKLASLVFGGLVGVAIALAVAWLRIVFSVNEILSSLMLNYVVMYAVNYLVAGPWRVGAFTITREVPQQYRFSWAEALAVLVVFTVTYWLIARKTYIGYEADVLGLAPRAAITYGVRPAKLITMLSILQGFSAGVGGAVFMLGFQNFLTPMSSPPGYGYMGVLVAWLSFLDPAASLAASLLYGFIGRVARLLQGYGVGFGVALAMQAVILLTLVAMMSSRPKGV